MAYDSRILFDLARDGETGEEVIVLIALGTHDEVY
jgi:mRNA-degrading endonuclease YafQ of YafQ-DinJ toxin-antitoxin module